MDDYLTWFEENELTPDIRLAWLAFELAYAEREDSI